MRISVSSLRHPTYYHQRHSGDPWHIDFCFIPERWASKVVRVDVFDGEPWSALSDHRPLVVDVDI
jgi:endonuclease/exonuclease/phosphatase family metal-dependent hydrolase